MSTSIGQAIVAVLESDLLTAAGQPVLTFLQSVGSAAGDPVKTAAAWVALQGALVGAAPALEAEVIQQTTAALAAKLQALIAQATAKPA